MSAEGIDVKMFQHVWKLAKIGMGYAENHSPFGKTDKAAKYQSQVQERPKW